MDGQTYRQSCLRWWKQFFCAGGVLLLIVAETSADERSWYRPAEALLMGGAYTSYGQEMPVMSNPALLGRAYQARVSFLEGQLSVTNLLENDAQNRFEDLPHDAFAVEDRLQGFPVYVQGGYTPGIRLGPFEFRYFVSYEHEHILINKTAPMLKLNYHHDQGLVGGFAYSWGLKNFVNTRMSSVSGEGHHFSIGVAGKLINREELRNDFALYSTTLLNLINDEENKDYEDYVEALGSQQGRGIGVDAGIDYFYQWNGSVFAAGVSVQDIGNTTFTPKEDGQHVRTRPMIANAGLMWRKGMDLFELILTADAREINQKSDFKKKLHYGIKLGMPYLHVLGGWHDHHLSYGVQVKLWPIELLAGSFKVD
ncbi:MAG: hypothetical protein J6Y94_02070, partial [Bacteriovoracaceae bacterium]|nr:hypothetical protein [Bacteriovoracaceae bacterium]